MQSCSNQTDALLGHEESPHQEEENINLQIYKTDLEISFMKSKEVLTQEPSEIQYKLIKNYILGRSLGSGTYGEVVEVIDKITLCRKAAKIITKHTIINKSFAKKNVINEISVLQQTKHSNIVQLWEVLVCQTTDTLYLIMDYCVCSIEDLLQSSPIGYIPECQSHLCFIQLIDGIEYLHRCGIIHNDIKPANLLLTFGHLLKIADFGTATIIKPFTNIEVYDSSFGTPAFQPPEIIMAPDNFPSFSKDIWSSGVTLCYITTGSLPFEGHNIISLYECIKNNNPLIQLAYFNPDLTILLLGILNKDREQRFTIDSIKKSIWYKKNPMKSSFVSFPGIDENFNGGIVINENIKEIIHNYSAPSDQFKIFTLKELEERYSSISKYDEFE